MHSSILWCCLPQQDMSTSPPEVDYVIHHICSQNYQARIKCWYLLKHGRISIRIRMFPHSNKGFSLDNSIIPSISLSRRCSSEIRGTKFCFQYPNQSPTIPFIIKHKQVQILLHPPPPSLQCWTHACSHSTRPLEDPLNNRFSSTRIESCRN